MGLKSVWYIGDSDLQNLVCNCALASMGNGVGSARRLEAGKKLLVCAWFGCAIAGPGPVDSSDPRWTILGPPGKPCNLTVLSGEHFAVLQWEHAPPDEGGLAIHYTFTWQEKDEVDATWFNGWVGVGEEHARLEGLATGAQYGGRIAAVNAHGRTWSDFVSFRTTEVVSCGDRWHWQGIVKEGDLVDICGRHFRSEDGDGSANPHKSPCSVTHVEYALAGIAAGSMIALLAGAVLARLAWAHTSKELFVGISSDGGVRRHVEEERLWEHQLRQREFAHRRGDALLFPPGCRFDHAAHPSFLSVGNRHFAPTQTWQHAVVGRDELHGTELLPRRCNARERGGAMQRERAVLVGWLECGDELGDKAEI